MGGIVGGVASIASGLIGSGAARSAASAEESYLNKALNFQEGVYNTAQTNLSPYISGGQSALGSIEQYLGLGGSGGNALSSYKAFTQTPYYTFPLSQGLQTLNQQAAAKGLNLSGGQLSGLQNYASNYASTNFSSYINALSSLAGLGQQSSVQLGNIGNQAGQNVGTTSSGLATAAGSGIIGSAQGIQNALSGLGSTLFGGTGSSYGGSGGSSNTGTSGLVSLLSGNNTIANALFGGSSGSGFTAANNSWDLSS